MGSTAVISKMHNRTKDFATWFEIPVWDIHRAATFYNTIYNMEMDHGQNGEFSMAYFPADTGVGGALIMGPGCVPSSTGILIYLNASNDMDNILARIDLAGGRIIMPKTLISEVAGHFALFIDSEGNRLALHEGSFQRPAAKAPAKKSAPRTPSKTASPAAKPARKK